MLQRFFDWLFADDESEYSHWILLAIIAIGGGLWIGIGTGDWGTPIAAWGLVFAFLPLILD